MKKNKIKSDGKIFDDSGTIEYFNTIILKRYSDKKCQKNSIAMIIKIVIKAIRVKKFFSTEF